VGASKPGVGYSRKRERFPKLTGGANKNSAKTKKKKGFRKPILSQVALAGQTPLEKKSRKRANQG